MENIIFRDEKQKKEFLGFAKNWPHIRTKLNLDSTKENISKMTSNMHSYLAMMKVCITVSVLMALGMHLPDENLRPVAFLGMVLWMTFFIMYFFKYKIEKSDLENMKAKKENLENELEKYERHTDENMEVK